MSEIRKIIAELKFELCYITPANYKTPQSYAKDLYDNFLHKSDRTYYAFRGCIANYVTLLQERYCNSTTFLSFYLKEETGEMYLIINYNLLKKEVYKLDF